MPLEELEQGRRHQASSLLPGVKIPGLLPTASEYWSHQKKQYSPAGRNNALFTQRKDSKSASVLGASLPCQQIPPSLQAAEQRAPISSPQGTNIGVGMARCHMMHTLKWSKGLCIESEVEKDTPTQRDTITSSEDSYLLVRKCFRPKAILMHPSRGSKDCKLKTAFPNKKEHSVRKLRTSWNVFRRPSRKV